MLRLQLISFLLFILPVVACPLWGQVVQKKQLTRSDYHLWGELQLDKISPNGKWASYRVGYESGVDTLFVRNTASLKTYTFPAGNNTTFTANNWFACLVDQQVRLVNLKTGKLETIANVTQYAFSADASKLILLITSFAGESTLLIRTPEGSTIEKINGVNNFAISPTSKELAYTVNRDNKNSVALFSLEKICHQSWILEDREESFNDFTWHESGKALTFFSRQSPSATINSVFYYRLDNKTVLHLNPKTQLGFPEDAAIVTNSTYKLSISDDLQKVFFAIKSNPETKPAVTDSDVELWNGNAKWIYPMQQKWGQFEEYAHLAVWYPMKQLFTPISTTKLPVVMLSGNQQYSILSNPQDYEPQFEFEGPRDFYIVDLATGDKNLLLRKHSSFYSDLLPSPTGKYIAYFREDNWWVYDIATKTHTNVTLNTGGQFTGKVHTLYKDSAYGNPGWSTNDNEILIYDQYDIWAITPDGTSYRKLTNGREKHIQFRLSEKVSNKRLKENFDGWKSSAINLEKEQILRAEGDDGRTGYFKWKSGLGEKSLVYGSQYIDQFTYSQKEGTFIYQEQRFDCSPRLMFKKEAADAKLLFQSNPQQAKYTWGKAELIEYHTSKNIGLKGVLFYPATYNPQKKYPMIVHVYEKQSNELHKYVNPTQFTEDGFNATAFTTQGYFVLYPDIQLEIGNPGIAAADCIVEATKEIISRGLVNPDKIGLIGHSFGGYETAFAISQTGIFATAVAGAAVTDLNSFYLNVGWNTGRPDMSRFQNDQWQMQKSPFVDPQAYNRNSPVVSADKISTPLLLWTGKEDNHVDWHQSIEYYLALRRLGKKNITLLYPKEGHTLLNPTNQKDLFERVQQWFGYYLKDEFPPLWISQGTK